LSCPSFLHAAASFVIPPASFAVVHVDAFDAAFADVAANVGTASTAATLSTTADLVSLLNFTGFLPLGMLTAYS
jgi:hypothetical protein